MEEIKLKAYLLKYNDISACSGDFDKNQNRRFLI